MELTTLVDSPILTPTLLALFDELNRAPPKAQASLFSAMAERIVSLATLDKKYEGQTIRPVGFYLIVATQNPDFQEGTYPLPEAQLDRFLVKVRVPYLDNLEDLLLRDETPPETNTDGISAEHAEEELVLSNTLSRLGNESDDAPPEQKGFFEYCKQIAEKLTKYTTAKNSSDHNKSKEQLQHELNQELKQLAKSSKFLQQVQRALIDLRVEWIESVRESIRDKIVVTPEMCRYIADYAYFTWSRTAAQELAPEIVGRIMNEEEFQNGVVANVRQGVMPRGAQALRDLAKAVRFVEATPQEIEQGGVKYATETLIVSPHSCYATGSR